MLIPILTRMMRVEDSEVCERRFCFLVLGITLESSDPWRLGELSALAVSGWHTLLSSVLFLLLGFPLFQFNF